MGSFKIKWFFFILFFTVGLAQAKTPDQVVKETAEGVISHIESNRSLLEANPEKIYDLVNELVIPRFDFISMSKWVLGKHWKNASEAQRSQFI